MNNLIRFVYISQSRRALTDPEIQQIIDTSVKNNTKNDVTGMLFYKGGYFLQVLEGETINVYYTFKKIRDDERHFDIKLLDNDIVDKRIFHNWSMAYKQSDRFTPELILEIDKIWKNPTRNNFDLLSRLGKFYLDIAP